MTKLERYNIHYVHDDGYLERDYRDDGDHVDAYEALDVIEKLELAVERATANMVSAQNRVAELEKALQEIIEHAEDYGHREGVCDDVINMGTKALEGK